MDAALRARIKREAPAQGISPAENPAPGADVAPTNVQPVAGTNHGATAKAETSAAPDGDRRRRSRREPSSERAFSPLDNYRHKQRLLPRSWRYLILAMTFSLVLAHAVTGRFPGTVSIAALLISLAGVSLMGQVRDRFVSLSAVQQRMMAGLTALLPLFLFGIGIARWAAMDGLPWDAAFAILVSVGAMAATYLRSMPCMILASQAAIWSATLIASSSMLGLSGLLVAGLFASLLSREQLLQQQAEDRENDARERAQTRARDILSDY